MLCLLGIMILKIIASTSNCKTIFSVIYAVLELLQQSWLNPNWVGAMSYVWMNDNITFKSFFVVVVEVRGRFLCWPRVTCVWKKGLNQLYRFPVESRRVSWTLGWTHGLVILTNPWLNPRGETNGLTMHLFCILFMLQNLCCLCKVGMVTKFVPPVKFS